MTIVRRDSTAPRDMERAGRTHQIGGLDRIADFTGEDQPFIAPRALQYRAITVLRRLLMVGPSGPLTMSFDSKAE